MVVYRPSNEKNSALLNLIGQARQDYERRFTYTKPINANGSLYLPRIVLIQGLCAITMSAEEDHAKARKKANNAYEALIDTVYVQRGATAFGGMKPLSHQHLFYITNWAAEKRRQDKVAQ
jgi:rhamnose utilization protein RhaD (predicted bifunctional aldolase and dehydrogenase)